MKNQKRQEILSAFCVADLSNPMTLISIQDALEAADCEYQVRNRKEIELRYRLG